MKSTTHVLGAVMLVLMSCGALANDVPLRFCVRDCRWWPVKDVSVYLSGCVDNPVYCKTGSDGCCVMDKWENAPHYCFGSGKNLCQWGIMNYGDQGPYVASPVTLQRRGANVTPKDYSCCKCDGTDKCSQKIYKDAASRYCPKLGDRDYNNFVSYTDPREADIAKSYFTVLFKPKDCDCDRRIVALDAAVDGGEVITPTLGLDTVDDQSGRKLKM